MKKLLLLLVLAIGISACGGDRGPQGPPGEGINRRINDFTMRSNDWQYATFTDPQIPNYFYYEQSWPEITSTVYTYGTVNVYLYQTVSVDGRPTEFLTPLPCTVYKEFEGKQFAEHYTFEYRQGYITFIMRDSDFELAKPPTQDFRVIVEW